MNDDDLKKLLRNALGERRVPEEARRRVLARFGRRRAWAWAWGAAAAALVGAAAVVLLPRAAPVPPFVATALEVHAGSEADVSAAAGKTSRELSSMAEEALGQSIEVPALRDAGLAPIHAHRCAPTGAVHVIYKNHWLKLSCFIMEAARVGDLPGGRLGGSGVEVATYVRGPLSAVAVRDGGLVKIWVAELRRDQLESIAVDAELKRYQLRTIVLSVPDGAAQAVEGLLLGMVGVEDVHRGGTGRTLEVRYDRRRVSVDHIAAVLALNGFEATPREGEGR